jgi:hypothetical protein
LTFKEGIENYNGNADINKRIEVYTYNNPLKDLSEFKPNFYDLLPNTRWTRSDLEPRLLLYRIEGLPGCPTRPIFLLQFKIFKIGITTKTGGARKLVSTKYRNGNVPITLTL